VGTDRADIVRAGTGRKIRAVGTDREDTAAAGPRVRGRCSNHLHTAYRQAGTRQLGPEGTDTAAARRG